MTNGWIKLHRKLLENPIFLNANLLQLFIYCLLRANHEPNEIIFNSALTKIERGQFITGRDVLAKDLKQNPMTLYKRLKVLEKLQYLNIKSNNRFSLVTIENYGLYQMHDECLNSDLNNKGTTKEHKQELIRMNKNNNSAFFESIWSLYPNKKGKASIKNSQKKVLEKLGYEVIAKCIERYKKDKPDWQEWKNGSTFFNSGYVDYLDENYSNSKPKNPFELAKPITVVEMKRS